MTASQKSLVISVLMITVGVGWLLTAREITPQINWVWTLGMAAGPIEESACPELVRRDESVQYQWTTRFRVKQFA